MVETPLHSFLKDVAQAYLLRLGCFVVDKKVSLTLIGQRRIHELDRHFVIDAAGIGERVTEDRGGVGFASNVLRGVEVKVSASDFRSGFICAGCNYNYVLAPMRLVAPSSLPTGVGLIEYNKHKFHFTVEGEDMQFGGLRVVRPSSFRSVPQFQIDNALNFMVRKLAPCYKEALSYRLKDPPEA